MVPVWLTDSITEILSRSIRYTLHWGLDGVVLRWLEGVCVPDVNEAKLRHRIADADLEVAAVDPGVFEGSPTERALWLNDLERLDETAAFCGRIGCRRIISGSLPGGDFPMIQAPLRDAADRLDRHNLELCLRIDGRGQSDAEKLAGFVRDLASSRLTLCWDPAAASEAGSDLSDMRIPDGPIGMVVVRDVRRTTSGTAPARLGEGDLPWTEWLRTLATRGYDGPLCLEFVQTNPTEALRDATTLIRLIRKAAVDR